MNHKTLTNSILNKINKKKNNNKKMWDKKTKFNMSNLYKSFLMLVVLLASASVVYSTNVPQASAACPSINIFLEATNTRYNLPVGDGNQSGDIIEIYTEANDTNDYIVERNYATAYNGSMFIEINGLPVSPTDYAELNPNYPNTLVLELGTPGGYVDVEARGVCQLEYEQTSGGAQVSFPGYQGGSTCNPDAIIVTEGTIDSASGFADPDFGGACLPGEISGGPTNLSFNSVVHESGTCSNSQPYTRYYTTQYNATSLTGHTAPTSYLLPVTSIQDSGAECVGASGTVEIIVIPDTGGPPTGDTISGTLYLADGVSVEATSRTLRLSRNGGTSVTATSTAGTGAYSFANVESLANGDVVTIWIDGGSIFGTTVLRYGTSCTGNPNCTGISVVRDQVRFENRHSGNFANSVMANCDNDTGTGCNTANIGFTSNGGNLTLSSGRTLFVPTGVTFTPGGTLTTPALNVAGTLNGDTNVTVNGSVSGNGSVSMTGGTFMVDGTSSFGGSTSWSFVNLTFGDGIGSTTTTATGAGNVTVSGTLTVAAYQTLAMGSKYYTISGTSTPFIVNGEVGANTSTVHYTGASANIDGTTFNNLTIGGTGSYSLPNDTLTVRGNLVITNGATLNKGSGTLVFSSSNPEQMITDNNATKQDLGNVQVSTPGQGSWCNISPSACNSSWVNRKKITFDNSTLGTSQTNFPVLVQLNSSNIDYAKTQNNGQDIRFVDADNITALSYEIERWNEAGTSLVWVKVPTLSNNNTDFIWMYYNNTSVGDGQSANNVWDENYRAVLHMNNNAGSTTVTDSSATATMSQGTNTANVSTNGKVGLGFDYNGTDTNVTNTTLPTTTALTWEAWIKPDVLNNYHSVIVENGTYILFDVYTGGNLSFWTADGYGGSNMNVSGITTGQWHHLVVAREGNSVTNGYKFYLNGVLMGQFNTGSITPGGSIYVGYRPGVGQGYDGAMDEVRISNSARSGDWIKATYNSINNLMNTFGSEELAGTNLILGSDIKISNLTVDAGQIFDENGTRTITFTGPTNPLIASGNFINEDSTVVFAPSEATVTTLEDGTYNNVILNGDGNTFRITSATTIKDLTITFGSSLEAPSAGELTLRGNFTNNGAFNHNGGTVKISPVGTSNRTVTIGGSSNTGFYGFTVDTPNTTVQFAAGRTYTFEDEFVVTGQSGSPIKLYSTTLNSQWFIDFEGPTTIDYLAVRDAGCSGASVEINPRLFDHGNNGACWRFLARGSAGSASGGGAGAGGSAGGGGAGGSSGSSLATAEAEIIFGQINRINITNPGSGYTTEPLVCIESDYGRAINATASIKNGALDAIELDDSGSDMTYANVIIAPPGIVGGSCGSTTGGGSGGGGGGGAGGGPGGGSGGTGSP